MTEGLEEDRQDEKVTNLSKRREFLDQTQRHFPHFFKQQSFQKISSPIEEKISQSIAVARR
jgi:hypothetical protein